MKHLAGSNNKTTDTILHDIFETYFTKQISAANTISNDYATLWREIYRLLQSGGKRLRPRMTFLSYQAFGGTDLTAIAPVAAAQELLHLCLLVHDDIIDRDYIRYGVPNVSGSYLAHYEPLVTDESTRTHYANSAAILGGDLLLSSAYRLIIQSTVSDRHKLLAHDLLSRATFEVAGGELLDTEAAFRPSNQVNTLAIARYKTAGYSFVVPLLTGAALADAPAERHESLQRFAENLGIAYQLQDDILGVFGSADKTGKSTVGDLREGKRTYLVEQFFAAAGQADQQLFQVNFGRPTATPQQINELKDLLVSSGAKQRTLQKIAELETLAQQELESLSLHPTDHDQFLSLITTALHRDK
jgi:geranylgeranyl pyrophosphate synthase